MYELSTLRHAVLVMIPQLCGSLQGFALFHIIIYRMVSCIMIYDAWHTGYFGIYLMSVSSSVLFFIPI